MIIQILTQLLELFKIIFYLILSVQHDREVDRGNRGTREHRYHIGDFAHVPPREVERVESAVLKHHHHAGYIAGIPAREIERGDRCVMGTVKKHEVHIGNIGSVPTWDVGRGETVAILEHIAHVSNIVGEPAWEVKRGEHKATWEHIAHIGDIVGVPVRDFERSETTATIEHTAHVGDCAGVDTVQIHTRAILEATEQLRAVASEAHLIGGDDFLHCRGTYIIAPLVATVELARDKCERACLAVEGVSTPSPPWAASQE